MQPSFVHLHVHSEFSLVDGINRIKPLVSQVRAAGMPAVAVTDMSNMFSLIKFYRAALAGGIKPIIGVDIWLRNPEDTNQPFRLLLLVQDSTGYRNLTELVSRSYQEGQHLGLPMLDAEWLNEQTATGLIALSGGREGDIGRALLARHDTEAASLLDHWLAVFGDRYYLQLVRTGRPGEEDYLHAAVDLAGRVNVPVVATNEVCFMQTTDFPAHEIRVCIHDGRTLDDPRRHQRHSAQQYLRSPEEMAELFDDIPEALQNSVAIAQRCNLDLTLGKSVLPDFPVPEGQTMDQYFRALSEKGLEARLQTILDVDQDDYQAQRQVYLDRLEIELSVIIEMGFPGYFLIVADFIQWAKDNAIPVGPGRGSGAGSLIAYAMLITNLDPIEHELLFERFLNPERVSMPDFDIDFCMDKRDLVIDYVARTYGRNCVSQIITYGTMAAKAVVRDVGRVLGHPYGFTDRVAKMVPFEIGMTLEKALQESDDLKLAYENDEEVTQLIDTARQLEGITRNAGKHAGGVVIAPGKLTDFSPLYCEADGTNLVTQFDKGDVELAGLVKFDFLGLRTLTIIDWALAMINREKAEKGEEPVQIDAIPMADPQAFDLLKAATTTAVFQLESQGMKELIKKLQPDSFEEITALVALFRPGPLQSGMVDDFIARKHGRQQVVYPHPDLESILEATYGVILYQEQVMQIAQVLANYTLGGADMLRRAMGKKDPKEMARQGDIFREGAVKRGVEEKTATYIFDLMEKFAGYGFNKSHSAAYALVSYQTLWLKCHYPAAFMAAVLSSDMDNTDKVVVFIEESRAIGLQVAPPDVNRSSYMFITDGDATLIYGLGAIKGVGEAAIEGIIEARTQGGAFRDLFDFCRRIDLRKANRRVLESMIKAGAMDPLGANRATLMIQLPLALRMAEQHRAMQDAGQNDLFGMSEPEMQTTPDLGVIPDDVEDWDDELRLQGEKETLGLFLTGHPIDFYEQELASIVTSRIGSLSLETRGAQGGGYGRRKGKPVTVAGLVMMVNRRNTSRGTMASVLLDDKTARIEATLFNEAFENYRELLSVDKILVMEGELAHDEYRGGLSLRVDRVMELEECRIARASAIKLRLPLALLTDKRWSPADFVKVLKQELHPYCGGTATLQLIFERHDSQGVVVFGNAWKVRPADQLLRRLIRLLGIDGLNIVYGAKPLGKSQNNGNQLESQESA